MGAGEMRLSVCLSRCVGVTMEFEVMDRSLDHNPTTEGELSLGSVKLFENLKEKNPPKKSLVAAGPALQVSCV